MAVNGIIIGAGNRGFIYADYALKNPSKFEIVGVAEPKEFRRNKIANIHKIKKQNIFQSWEIAAKKNRIADCVLITTQDRMHKDPAISFAKKGYHIFLEKPMAPNLEDCEEIVKACEEADVLLAVGHVLRYHPHAILIKRLIDQGLIGTVVNIQHTEPIGFWHFCHSFVRGNWANEARSSSLLLAKCCHDVDLIDMWMGEQSACKQVSSFGSLLHFRPENKPEGASDRCVTCAVEKVCPASAKKHYVEPFKKGHKSFPLDVITDVPSLESINDALQRGPYGRCVFTSDNDACDNQVVILQFENGATASLITCAFSEQMCVRRVNICGTRGEIRCEFNSDKIAVYDYLLKKTTSHDVTGLACHSECDVEAIRNFVGAIEVTLRLLMWMVKRRRNVNKMMKMVRTCLPHFFYDLDCSSIIA